MMQTVLAHYLIRSKQKLHEELIYPYQIGYFNSGCGVKNYKFLDYNLIQDADGNLLLFQYSLTQDKWLNRSLFPAQDNSYQALLSSFPNSTTPLIYTKTLSVNELIEKMFESQNFLNDYLLSHKQRYRAYLEEHIAPIASAETQFDLGWRAALSVLRLKHFKALKPTTSIKLKKKTCFDPQQVYQILCEMFSPDLIDQHAQKCFLIAKQAIKDLAIAKLVAVVMILTQPKNLSPVLTPELLEHILMLLSNLFAVTIRVETGQFTPPRNKHPLEDEIRFSQLSSYRKSDKSSNEWLYYDWGDTSPFGHYLSFSVNAIFEYNGGENFFPKQLHALIALTLNTRLKLFYEKDREQSHFDKEHQAVERYLSVLHRLKHLNTDSACYHILLEKYQRKQFKKTINSMFNVYLATKKYLSTYDVFALQDPKIQTLFEQWRQDESVQKLLIKLKPSTPKTPLYLGLSFFKSDALNCYVEQHKNLIEEYEREYRYKYMFLMLQKRTITPSTFAMLAKIRHLLISQTRFGKVIFDLAKVFNLNLDLANFVITHNYFNQHPEKITLAVDYLQHYPQLAGAGLSATPPTDTTQFGSLTKIQNNPPSALTFYPTRKLRRLASRHTELTHFLISVKKPTYDWHTYVMDHALLQDYSRWRDNLPIPLYRSFSQQQINNFNTDFWVLLHFEQIIPSVISTDPKINAFWQSCDKVDFYKLVDYHLSRLFGGFKELSKIAAFIAYSPNNTQTFLQQGIFWKNLDSVIEPAGYDDRLELLLTYLQERFVLLLRPLILEVVDVYLHLHTADNYIRRYLKTKYPKLPISNEHKNRYAHFGALLHRSRFFDVLDELGVLIFGRNELNKHSTTNSLFKIADRYNFALSTQLTESKDILLKVANTSLFFDDEHCLIGRLPENGAEVYLEGEQLKHCIYRNYYADIRRNQYVMIAIKAFEPEDYFKLKQTFDLEMFFQTAKVCSTVGLHHNQGKFIFEQHKGKNNTLPPIEHRQFANRILTLLKAN